MSSQEAYSDEQERPHYSGTFTDDPISHAVLDISDNQTILGIEVTSLKRKFDTMESRIDGQAGEGPFQISYQTNGAWIPQCIIGPLRSLLIPKSAGEDVNALKDELAFTMQKLEALDGSLVFSHRKIKSLKSENRQKRKYILELESELDQLEEQRKSLEKDQFRLKDIIVNNESDENEPTTAELLDAFESLVGCIKLICYKIGAFEKPNFSFETSQHVRQFWERIIVGHANSVAASQWRLRRELFKLLKEMIFDEPCFGLTGQNEASFREVEKTFMKMTKAERNQAVIDWRRATIKCINASYATSSFRSWCKAPRIIYEHLLPILGKNKDFQDKIKHDLSDLCEKALDLALRMRESRSIHEIVEIEPGREVLNIDNFDFKVEGCESHDLNEKDLNKSTVAYTLFGALIRRDFGVGQGAVVGKARVVVEILEGNDNDKF